jgi:hypothetical protein
MIGTKKLKSDNVFATSKKSSPKNLQSNSRKKIYIINAGSIY